MAHVTIPNEATRITYTVGATATDTFAIPFAFFQSDGADVGVYDGATQLATSVYTITPTSGTEGGYVGGSCVLDTAVTSTTITLVRDITVERTSDFPISGPFNITTLNTELDTITAINQDLEGRLDRSVFRKETSTETYSLEWPDGATTTASTVQVTSDGGITLGPDPSAAATQATAAAASAAAAATSETNAGTSETNAATSKTNAATSETNAAASAVAAAAAAASNLFSKVLTKSADYTIVADTDDGTMFVCDMTSGNVDFDLPSIATAGEGERYGFLRSGASNSLTFTRNGTDTINGVAGTFTVDAVDGAMLIIIADEASPDNWLVVPWSQVEAGAGLTKSGGSMTLDLTSANTWTGDQTLGPITETQTTKSASFTPSVSVEGTVYSCSGTMTITMPTATAGKGFTIIHSSASSITWAGTILWADGAAPTAAAAVEIYVFVSDGTNWYGNLAGTGYA